MAAKPAARTSPSKAMRVARDPYPASPRVQKAVAKQLKSATRQTNKLKAKRPVA